MNKCALQNVILAKTFYTIHDPQLSAVVIKVHRSPKQCKLVYPVAL